MCNGFTSVRGTRLLRRVAKRPFQFVLVSQLHQYIISKVSFTTQLFPKERPIFPPHFSTATIFKKNIALAISPPSGGGGAFPAGCRGLQPTPFWMAPEVILGQEYGAEADVWSLGATVLEVMNGRPPWYDLGPVRTRLPSRSGRADFMPRQSVCAEGGSRFPVKSSRRGCPPPPPPQKRGLGGGAAHLAAGVRTSGNRPLTRGPEPFSTWGKPLEIFRQKFMLQLKF